MPEAGTPERLRDAVVVACDGAYLPHALCLLEGIARLHPGRGFDLCVLCPDPVELPPGLEAGEGRVLAPGDNPFAGVTRSRHGLATFL